MEGIKFADVLRSFEKKAEDDEYVSVERDYNERKVIENDVRRTELLGVDKRNRKVIKVLKRLLFVELDKIPIKYTQGMSEIASVFVLYYFQNIVEEEVAKGVLASGSDEESAEESAADGFSEQFIEAPEDENVELKRFVSRHKDTTAILGIVLTNVFRRKLEPLVVDDFKLYKENMRIFVEMMKKKGIRIPELESYKFMGSILTFFLRNLSRMEDVHKVFEIILSCPNTCPFLLLVLFYDKISNGKTIDSIVNNDLFPKVVKLEEEFVETKKRVESRSGFSRMRVMLVGGIASIVAAVVVYKITKKE
ncbi:hypothetical protein [Encephalitozoon cuniculi GB-M1]|uniref:Uncharacterized membrane protein ECU10_0880 n=1 Tax=Encephalitozoon cuniculi (strain GB-M1) TaxID=284813 RepID=YA88_ENCCU|nr:uncharacterized protein ECU10_0880 [Encephalitozoon cuniculi GB-M1]Q8SUE5.1 RecName: Full=Uncharacterized membrane protein ECU10_0880 [Encephalitozoon cuniculi GB-M1]CAD25807.1 hypothetical protein [Encephalitozoon cuniculi GB-M1]